MVGGWRPSTSFSGLCGDFGDVFSVHAGDGADVLMGLGEFFSLWEFPWVGRDTSEGGLAFERAGVSISILVCVVVTR